MLSRRPILVALLALAGLLSCRPAGGGATPLTTVRVASGLTYPVFVTGAPEDFIRLFIVEKRGLIKIVNLDTGRPNVAPFLDIDSLVEGGNSSNDERGLLGLAFHPNYPTNGFFYVNYTGNNGATTIERYSVSGDPDIADPGSGMTLLTISQPYENHNGGWIAFGPHDRYLYIATGDGGLACDPGSRAQDITNQLLGKMLRIDVDGDDFPGDPNRNYTIPPDNPFVGETGDDEIWAYGLRNPWRCSFDRQSGDLYLADVGQDVWEEVDFQAGSNHGGQNYGWDCMEGDHCSSGSGCGAGGCTCFAGSLVVPIHEYSHGGSPFRCSITGGYVYRGCAIADLHGTYFFADYCSNQIWSFRYDGANLTEFTDRTAELDPPGAFSITSISSFGEDTAGELYIVKQTSSGEVYKIVPADGPQNDCNENGVEDACDILNGTSSDGDGNGVPDECEAVSIVSSDPPDGAIDARQPTEVDGSGDYGWSEVELTFSADVTGMTPADFTITLDPPAAPPVLALVTTNGNVALLQFGEPEPEPIPTGHWTIITHNDSQSDVRIGYLPADVNASRMSNSADVLDLIDFLNGVPPPLEVWQTDINRSGATNSADILDEIDLLNGAQEFDAWNGQTLPGL